MSISDGKPRMNAEAAMYTKYAEEFAAYAAAAHVEAAAPSSEEVGSLYAHLLRAGAVAAVSDSVRTLLNAATEQLARDVFIVARAHPQPKLVAGRREYDQVFSLVHTYAEYAHQKQEAYARITASTPTDAVFATTVGGVYAFMDCYGYELWSLQMNDHDYCTMRAYVCFLLGLYSTYIAPAGSTGLVSGNPVPSSLPPKKSFFKFWT